MADPSSWCTIESDPGVFTELCETIGVQGIQFEEMYSLDEDTVRSMSKVYGLVFLFKWQAEKDPRPIVHFPDEDLFFAKQVIQNACATQAILSVLMNQAGNIDIGPELRGFREFTQCFDAYMKGEAISNSDTIRIAHNSFHKVSSFEIEHDEKEPADDAFHFISYVPFKGKIYELDGLKNGPIEVGQAPEEGWLEGVMPEIRRRIDKYQNQPAAEASANGGGESELRFTLLAIVEDPRRAIDRLIEVQRHVMQRASVKLISLGEDVMIEEEVDDDAAPAGVPAFEELPDEVDALQRVTRDARVELLRLRTMRAQEDEKRGRWKKENARRRHDFVPLILAALRHMARRGELLAGLEKGRQAATERHEANKEKKAAAKN